MIKSGFIAVSFFSSLQVAVIPLVVRSLAYVKGLQHPTLTLHRKSRNKVKALFHLASKSPRDNTSLLKSDFSLPPLTHLVPRPLVVSGPLISSFVTTVAFATVVIRVAESDGKKTQR